MAQYAFVMKDLTRTYNGGKKVIDGVTLSFLPGAKIGVLGINGAGKSTLMKIMAGVDKEFTGEAWAADGFKIGYLPQEPQLDPTKNVHENVMEALADTKKLLEDFTDISMKLGEVTDNNEMMALIEKQGELQDKIEAVDGWEIDSTIEIAMDALRCPPGDSAVDKLSGGEKRRVALCKLLLEKPDILLLDEPTNHLDAESVAWLERTLKDYKGMVVMITHDRYFLDNVTGWILEMHYGRAMPYEGNYSAWVDAKQKRMQQEKSEDASRERTLAREKEWMGQSAQARRTKSKSRIAAYDQLLKEQEAKTDTTAQIIIPTPPRLGENVIDAEHLFKSFGDRMLIEDLDFKIPAGAIVGIIGPNGAGKTTFMRMITGQEKPDTGAVKVGDTVVLGYVDQSRDSLDANKTVWEEISGGDEMIDLGKRSMQSRAYTSSFNFKGSDQQKKVGSLSGGERNRVHLAKMLRSGANVLMLDEPTNDLDVDTLRALEDAINDFAGCVLVTSHDRWFLDRLATHILAFEGDSHVEWFEGNYEDYEADRRRRLGIAADQPHKIKYKPLTRK